MVPLDRLERIGPRTYGNGFGPRLSGRRAVRPFGLLRGMEMIRIAKLAAAGAAILVVAGCASYPQNTGTLYECNRGTRLQVDYVANGAIVRVDGRRSMVLKAAPTNMGQAYENKSGARLYRNGNEVTWNTAARTAPESCRPVNRPM
ncbi:MAG: lysozyme inhibitor [Sphingopyxis terrae]|nr:MAG: lysozyme inhibitor [Sphingopyxis terrae]